MSAAETVAAEKPDCTQPPASGAVAAESVRQRVAAGICWRETYQVAEAFGESEGRWFAARHVGTGENVWLRVSSANTAADRDRLWPLLCALDSPHLQKPVEAHSGAERVEVWRAPEAPTLRQWRADCKAPAADEIRRFVRQMHTALELLHTRGLGHFGVRPDNVFVRPGPDGPVFCLGGFDAVECVDQPELIPIAVNVLNAPPEAAGLFKHSPGPLLLAWDWWSLGRVVQEMILGRHVLLLAPPELTTHPPRSRLQLAEAMLFERDIGALRAGGVELMPALEPEIAVLLRGLLTSAKEGRWGTVEVREWLDGKTPKERYGQSRQQRFFRLEGRGCTPPEAARILSGPAHRADAVAHVFGAEEPGRFAHFLHETRAKHNFHDLLEQAAKLTQAAALKGIPPEITREIATAIALMAISGGEFYWGGQPLAPALADLLETSPDIFKTCTLLRAFAPHVVLDLIKHYDSTAAGRLESLVTGASEAELLLDRCGLPRSNPAQDLRDLWQLALKPAAKLTAKVDALRQSFACTTNPALQKIFAAPHPTHGMLVLLAWTGRDPQRHGFLTHLEVKERKLAELTAEGRAVAQLLFWHRLERALRAGPLLFGDRWPILGGGLTLVLLLAVHVPGPAGLVLGFTPFAALLLLRLGLNRRQAELVRTWTQSSPWTWRDGIRRCRAEAQALANQRGLPNTLMGSTSMLQRINADIAAIAGPDRDELVRWPPRHWSAWLLVVVSWTVLAGLAAGSMWRTVTHPPSWAAHAGAWQQSLHHPVEEKVVAPEDQKQSWPYKLQLNSPFPPLEIKTEDTFEPSGAQFKAALERARQLVSPYKPETIDAMIAIYVPLEDGRCGLLFYEGKKRQLMTGKGAVIPFVPMPKQWLKLGEQFMVFIEK